MGRELTIRQRKFCDYYVECGNATEAAIKAGYAPKYAGANTDKLLKNTKLKKLIDARLEELSKTTIADAEEVLMYLTAVLRGEETEKIPIGMGEGAQRLIDKEPSIKDRMRAGELIGKRHGIFIDRLQADVDAEFKISFDYGDVDDDGDDVDED